MADKDQPRTPVANTPGDAPDPAKIAEVQEKLANSKDALVATTTTGRVYAPRGVVPDTEPGHKGEELNPGNVYDPNAARRKAEGRGPGLQDSERLQPAHWQQPVDEDA